MIFYLFFFHDKFLVLAKNCTAETLYSQMNRSGQYDLCRFQTITWQWRVFPSNTNQNSTWTCPKIIGPTRGMHRTREIKEYTYMYYFQTTRYLNKLIIVLYSGLKNWKRVVQRFVGLAFSRSSFLKEYYVFLFVSWGPNQFMNFQLKIIACKFLRFWIIILIITIINVYKYL